MIVKVSKFYPAHQEYEARIGVRDLPQSKTQTEVDDGGRRCSNLASLQSMQNNSTRLKEFEKIASLETLKTVDQYTIKNHLLGEGTYAKTYLALNSSNEILACKMIIKKNLIEKINKSKNKTYTRDFLTGAIRSEVNVWKTLHHEHIASFKGYIETENNVYFLLEYCSDGTLQSVLRQKKFDQVQALQIFKQIVDGCQYLYDKGILHRDLKPENIMLHNGVVKIVDFGFAKLVEDDRLKNHSVQRICVGTPIYMSPQVLLEEPYSIKCDVWSLGVILYRLLCGVLPWQKFDKLESLMEAVKLKPSFPSGAKVDPTLKQLIMAMLVFDQKSRASIKQVKNYLQSLQQI